MVIIMEAILVAILVLICLVNGVFLFQNKEKNVTINVQIPEIKLKMDNTPTFTAIEDNLYDDKGDPTEEDVNRATIDEVLQRVNSIMYGDDIVEGGEDK